MLHAHEKDITKVISFFHVCKSLCLCEKAKLFEWLLVAYENFRANSRCDILFLMRIKYAIINNKFLKLGDKVMRILVIRHGEPEKYILKETYVKYMRDII